MLAKSAETATDNFWINSPNSLGLATQLELDESSEKKTDRDIYSYLDEYKKWQAEFLIEKSPTLKDALKKAFAKKSYLSAEDFIDDPENKQDVKNAFDELAPELKQEFITKEQKFYPFLHTKHGFQAIDWPAKGEGIKIKVGEKEVHLKESTVVENGVNFRKVELPSPPVGGELHMSLVLLDSKGNRPLEKDALYFSVHYDSNGMLQSMTMPQPITPGNSDSLVKLERNGEVYTLPITYQQYEGLYKEIAQNKTVAEDRIVTQAVKPNENAGYISSDGSSQKGAGQILSDAVQPQTHGVEGVSDLQDSARSDNGGQAADAASRIESSQHSSSGANGSEVTAARKEEVANEESLFSKGYGWLASFINSYAGAEEEEASLKVSSSDNSNMRTAPASAEKYEAEEGDKTKSAKKDEKKKSSPSLNPGSSSTPAAPAKSGKEAHLVMALKAFLSQGSNGENVAPARSGREHDNGRGK